MKIESSSFRVRDDYGLFIEVKSIKEIPSEEASKEIFNFFSKYRIVAVHKDINVIDKHKESLAVSITKQSVEPIQKVLRPAKRLSMKELVYIVKKLLPTQFGMNDFIDYMNSKEEYNGYIYEDKKEMWKTVYAHLKINKKIELISKGGQKSQYKYRYIGIDKPEDDTNLKINSLKNGESVVLG